MFFRIDVLKDFANFTVSIFNKAADFQASFFIKKVLQHWCFPVKFAKFLRTPFFTEFLRWLLLFLFTKNVQRFRTELS